MYLVGGVDKEMNSQKSVMKYCFDYNTWVSLPEMEYGRDHPISFVTNTYLYVFGGNKTCVEDGVVTSKVIYAIICIG